ncbi:MAG: hypothetical protein ALAOOOJD_03532 [bacterium]|nr:hypothetical protein [bacterium]
MLQDDFFRVGGPFHARDVIVARVAGDVNPARFTATRADHTDAAGGIRGADLRILHGNDERIKRVGVVDQQKIAHARGIQLPISNRLAVGTPAPTITQIEFFLIHPIERAVNDGARAILRERGDFAAVQIFHINIVFPHVTDGMIIRRKFCKHQCRGLGVAAKLAQLPGREIEHPIIAARVSPPHPLRVGENKQALAIRRPLIVFDI